MSSKVRLIGFRCKDKYNGQQYCITECKHCNGILEFLSSDIKTRNLDDNTYIKYVECSNCKNETILLKGKSEE